MRGAPQAVWVDLACAARSQSLKTSLLRACAVFARSKVTTMAANILKTESISTTRGELQFAIMGGKSRRRVRRLLEKDPETVAWIDRFQPQSTFWDVGANIGVFSLYAALDPTTQVVAVEPGAVNFFLLAASIELNRMEEQVSPFCIGFDERTQLSRLNATQSIPGASFKIDIGSDSRPFNSSQAALCYSIDDFVGTFKVPTPTYLKIDVPRLSHHILRGGAATIRRSTREILVELDSRTFEPGEMDTCVASFEQAGFALAERFAKKNPEVADYLFVRQ